jgi:trk system potassium uptake protein
MDVRPVFFIVGILLATLGAAMVVPAVVDFVLHDFDWQVFLLASCVTVFVGLSLILSCRSGRPEGLGLRQTFLLTALSWIALASSAALPFAFSNLPITVTDAFFEAMSGLTTTGSTVLTGLDTAPVGILLWRAILQWVGGVGIIVMAVTALPYLRIGGMQLFRTESSDLSEKVLPRITQITGGILALYAAFTGLCAALLWVAGMSPFEAVVHAMTTLSTGGFSTSDASIGLFDSIAVECILVVFMLVGGITFTLYLRAWHGKPQALRHNRQVRWFLGLIAISATALSSWLIVVDDVAPFLALRQSLFHVVSIVTTTGFTAADYGQWGSFPVALLYFLTFVGGCTGSTAGGLKIFRLQVLYALALAQLRRVLYPHAVFQPTYDGRPVSEAIGLSVLGFFFLFGFSFCTLSLLLSLCGLDLATSISGAATAIANVGPGLGGVIGPASNFATLPDLAKWVMAVGMLLGRLELVTLLILFHPSFWRY